MAVPARQLRAPSAFDASVEALFAGVMETLPGRDWIQQTRADALARFVQAGLPHRRVEWWKYTDLAPRVEGGLRTAKPGPGTARPRMDVSPGEAIDIDIAEGHVTRLPLEGLPDGVEVMPYRDALAVPSLWLRPWLKAGANPIDNLNLAFAADGVLIRVGAGRKLKLPVVVRNWHAAPGTMVHIRNVVALEEGAELTLVEIEQSGTERQTFGTNRTSIELATGAKLRHIRIQTGTSSAITLHSDDISLGQASSYKGLALVGGPGLSRQDIAVSLDGEGAQFDIAGGYAAAAGQLADLSLAVMHKAPRTVSRILAKGIASGNGHGVVQGRVHVCKEAQQTDSHQLARGLILSPGAEINHRPELEIYADDVKCGHGAAIGSLDENQLFYMQSRGIPAAEARQILVGAYFAELVERVPDAMRDEVNGWIAAHLTHAGGAA